MRPSPVVKTPGNKGSPAAVQGKEWPPHEPNMVCDVGYAPKAEQHTLKGELQIRACSGCTAQQGAVPLHHAVPGLPQPTLGTLGSSPASQPAAAPPPPLGLPCPPTWLHVPVEIAVPVYVGEALQHHIHPAPHPLLREQPVTVLHQLVQVAVLDTQGEGVGGWGEQHTEHRQCSGA